MKPFRIGALTAAAICFLLGGVLTYLLLVSYDSGWVWVGNLTGSGWGSILMPSALTLALVGGSSVWAWRVFGPQSRSRWVLPVALGSWWFTWWLVPSNLAILGIDASQNLDWDATLVPPDTVLWAIGSVLAVATWLVTLTIWYGRRADARNEPGPDTAPASSQPSHGGE